MREFCARHGGSRPATSVPIAKNGLGAVTFIRSVRAWASKALGDERALALGAMASAEDLRLGAEHERMADQFVEVPAGASNNNCANVRLIVETAGEAGVGAVWPGWGHASEYPELKRENNRAGEWVKKKRKVLGGDLRAGRPPRRRPARAAWGPPSRPGARRPR